MAASRTCDICGQQTDEIVAKLFLAPVNPGQTRATHSNYTAHADVGKCCLTKVRAFAKWQQRKTNAQNGRRLRAKQ